MNHTNYSRGSIRIRRLGKGDVDVLRAAVRELIQDESGSDGPSSSAHLERVLTDERSYFLVGNEGDRPVGYLSAYRFPAVDYDGFMVYLYDVTVHPNFRRRGIGAQLVRALLRECERDDVAEIWVGTSTTNVPAQRTFESTGGKRVSDSYVEYTFDLDE